MKVRQPRCNNRKHNLTPLWIISIFFSFTEVMLGYAVINTGGGMASWKSGMEIMRERFATLTNFPYLVAPYE
jgi:hypothetical protein